MSSSRIVIVLAVSGLAVWAQPRTNPGLPILFEKNVGQAETAADFVSHGAGYSVLLKKTGAVFHDRESTVKMELIDADSNSQAVGMSPLDTRVHYLLGGDPDKWRTGVPVYARVEFRNVYPGVTLAYYSSQQQLKYDFIVAPGADPARIRMRFEGMAEMRRDSADNIVQRTTSGEFRHYIPLVYQVRNGRRREVKARYSLRGSSELAFELEEYDRANALIIDPVIVYDTYLGGRGNNAITGIAVDSAGATFVTGWAETTDLAGATGTQVGPNKGVNAFVAKLNPGGASLAYLTYLGGGSEDRGFAIAVDNSDCAIITGWTYSSDFPTVAAAQRTFGGGRDAFVAKLNASGGALLFSTFLGGSGYDGGAGIALDSAGSVYIAGGTNSTDFPLANAFQSRYGGLQDAFVAKFSSAGVLQYSTYLGGLGNENAAAIAVDAAGNAYVTGGTDSTNFPTMGPYQAANAGGQDAFVAKLNPSGSALVYSTYVGGSGGSTVMPEAGTGIAVDAGGSAYVTGNTCSSNFPIVNAFQGAIAGRQDAFVLKLSPAGNALTYSTYLGGSSGQFATAIAVDGGGSAYVTGYTAAIDFPAINAVQASNAGNYDVFLAVLAPAGNSLTMATYLGGTNNDTSAAIALDAAGDIFLGGETSSTNFPANGTLQSYLMGSNNAFIVELSTRAGQATASFVKSDSTTQGSWKGAYGGAGFVIAGDSTNVPAFAQVTPAASLYVWADPTSDARALQQGGGSSRVAGTWYGWTTFTVDLALTDGQSHEIALYSLDYDTTARSQRIEIVDAVTSTVLDSRTVSGFNGGQYLVWRISGHVTIRFTRLAGMNAVLGGIFFDGQAIAQASFLGSDTATEGTWKGTYGGNGYAIAGDSAALPSFARVTLPGSLYVWANPTSDPRALQQGSGSSRVAGTWYDWNAFTIDVNLTDGLAHRVSVYCLDWDNYGRAQTIDILDSSNNVLDSRSIGRFTVGEYLTWNLTGHVTIRVTRTAGVNAVVSGLFFN